MWDGSIYGTLMLSSAAVSGGMGPAFMTNTVIDGEKLLVS